MNKKIMIGVVVALIVAYVYRESVHAWLSEPVWLYQYFTDDGDGKKPDGKKPAKKPSSKPTESVDYDMMDYWLSSNADDQSLNYYEVLELRNTANINDIKDRWTVLQQMILKSPTLKAMSKDEVAKYNAVLKAKQNAYKTLSNAKKKAQYDQQVFGSVPPSFLKKQRAGL